MYAIMRNEKCHLADVGGIQAECNRSPDKTIKLPASDIDWTKTGTNEFYEKCENFRKTIKAECSGHGVDRIRRDAVVMIDSFFGASPDFFETADPETVDRYFKNCVDFAGKYFGEVINAVRHNDEKTPHLHIQSIPLVNNADGSFSLSAKRLMGTQTDYRRRQDLFYTEVAEKFGFDPCEKVQDAVEKRIHYDSLEFKTRMRTEELEKVTAELDDKTDLLEKASADLQTVNHELEVKTGLLEKAFDRIESVCNTFFRYAAQIYKDLSGRISDFIEKIHDKRILTEDDFSEANMQKEEISVADDQSNPLFLPVTSAGDRLSWDGVSPIYEEFEPDCMVPYGAVDNKSGRIFTENQFDWSESFQPDEVDEYSVPAEMEINDSMTDLEFIKNDIAEVIGRKTDIEKAEEDFSFLDSPTQPDPDDDDGYDDVGTD